MQELKFKHNSFTAKPICFRLVESKYITPLHIPVSGDVPIILMQLKYTTRIIISRSTFTEIINDSSTSRSILWIQAAKTNYMWKA